MRPTCLLDDDMTAVSNDSRGLVAILFQTLDLKKQYN